ncbi:MAG: heavy-metal-associated domain-containing protein [Tannerella sp.]|jgi:Cu+-exporting ATPase|nr:heavy-metal-associated domain-containing protein [Tannerella sp.]
MNTKLKIGGMGCAACAQRIEKAVAKLEGITSVSVNLAAETADVTYDPQKVSLPDIGKTIEKAGYEMLENS